MATARAAPADQPVFGKLLQAVRRADFFAAARTVIKNRLPVFAAIHLAQLPFYRFFSVFPAPGAVLPTPLQTLLNDLHSRLQRPGNAPGRSSDKLLTALQRELDSHNRKPQVLVRFGGNGQELVYGAIAANGIWQSFDDLDPATRLDACCRLIVALGSVLLENRPIMLFSVPQPTIAGYDLNFLPDLLRELSGRNQCLCACNTDELFPGATRIGA